MRRGPDELDAALVCLVVRPRALEARQERVVDVDRPAVELLAQVVGEHLHVAGQHDQVDVEFVDQLQQLLPLPRAWSRGVTGMWWKGTP